MIKKNKNVFMLLVAVLGAGAVYWYVKKSKEAKIVEALNELNKTQDAGSINFDTLTA